jgi:hypothetical protein
VSAAARRAGLITAALTGILVGSVATMALTDVGVPTQAPRTEPEFATTGSTVGADVSEATPPSDRPGVLLVWTSGGLPAALGAQVEALEGVEAVTMVWGDETRMTASFAADGTPVDAVEPGWFIPLDTLAVDPASFASFLSGDAVDAVRALVPGQVLLTETSARLRRVGEGASVWNGEADMTVAGVIDDVSGAGAELLVAIGDAERVGVTTARYLLVSHTGSRELLQRAIADRLAGRAVRFRSPAETTWLRHGDAVEPSAVIKATFGEFSARDGSGRDVHIDPDWVARWIVTESVPILGPVTCHRKIVASLRDAMAELEQANLAHLVVASDFAGCFSARRIAAGQPLSHHAWGVAIDLNVDGNPRGSFSTQDPRLVQTLAQHGFTWGGTWLVPDPAHYEAPVPPP